MAEVQAGMTLDATGLACPLPIIRVKHAIKQLAVGAILEVWTTDPGSLTDVPAWVQAQGHELVQKEDQAPPFKFWIRRVH
ncbi:MAG: sulfurtransferase TusA family protein [Firmicutes bacterium]|nr:sulfurtransferase TusA family protein [Bacillota bacterium]